MKPTVGRIILTKNVVESNGTTVHPAIVTRTWNDSDTLDPSPDPRPMVNATVLPDNRCTLYAASSVLVFETEEEGDAACGDKPFGFVPPRS